MPSTADRVGVVTQDRGLRRICRRGVDIWQDTNVLHYLLQRQYPPSTHDSEKSRIRKRARQYVVEEPFLFKISRHGSEKRRVPAVHERLDIVKHAHEALHHRKEKSMLRCLRSFYFWDHMADDVKTVITSCFICQQMKLQNYVQQDYCTI